MDKDTDDKPHTAPQPAVAYAPATAHVHRTNRALVAAHWAYFGLYAVATLAANCTLLRPFSPVHTGVSRYNDCALLVGVSLNVDNITGLFTGESLSLRMAAHVNVLLFVSAIVSLRLVSGRRRHDPPLLLRVVAVATYLAVAAIALLLTTLLVVRQLCLNSRRVPWEWFLLLLVASALCCALHGLAIAGFFAKNRPIAQKCLPYSTILEAAV